MGRALGFLEERAARVDESQRESRDAALKVLTVAVSGVMGYLGTTAQGSPRWDYVTVLWVAIIALALAVIGAIDARSRREARQRDEDERHAEIIARMDSQDRRTDAQDRRLDLIIEAQQQVMRSSLIRDAERYCRRGFVTPEEHRAYSEAYGSYEHLGLNGYIRTYVERVDALPVRDVDEVIGSESTD